MMFLVTNVNIPAPAEAASNWRAPIRSRDTSSTRRVKAENSTTSVVDPSAVTSTAAIVSHGVRSFATARRIALSMAATSPSINSLVIRTNIRNKIAAPPNQRERCPARDENKGRFMNIAVEEGRKTIATLGQCLYDLDVLELAGFVEGADAYFAGAEAKIDGVQGGDGVAVHGDVNGAGGGVVSEFHVMPAASGGQRGGAAIGADADALAAINVKDAVVHGLLVGGVEGEVGVVE